MSAPTIIRSRNQTVYIKDVLPQAIRDALKDPNYDLDKLLLHQIKVLSSCKKALLQERSSLLASIHKKCEETSNTSCGPFGQEFLNILLKDIVKDEADAKRKVLGEQESVEMFKQAYAQDEVSENYVTAARAYRDSMTMRLAEIVEEREIVHIALEILQRSPQARLSQNDPRMEAIGITYTEARDRHSRESDILKKLTEWKDKPELHITEEDELFSFFSDEVPSSLLDEPDNKNETKDHENDREEADESQLASALAPYQDDASKLVNFKNTKIDSVDNEFNILAGIAENMLKHDQKMRDSIALMKQTPGCIFSTESSGIEQYIAHLKVKHHNLKFKISTKGYNFSLKVMQKTKSVISLDLLSTLLAANQDLPDEVKEAQKIISNLSSAVKGICSKYGRCRMVIQSLIKRQNSMEVDIKEAPKVNYAESLRISSNFSANMKEVVRLNGLTEEIKKIADRVLEEVAQIYGQSK